MKSGTSPGFLTSMTGRKELLSVDEVGYGLSMPARLSELTLSPYTIERKHLNLHFQSNSFSLESLVAESDTAEATSQQPHKNRLLYLKRGPDGKRSLMVFSPLRSFYREFEVTQVGCWSRTLHGIPSAST